MKSKETSSSVFKTLETCVSFQDEQFKKTSTRSSSSFCSEKWFFRTSSNFWKSTLVWGLFFMMTCLSNLILLAGTSLFPFLRRFDSWAELSRAGPCLQLIPSQKISGLANEQSVLWYGQKQLNSPVCLFFSICTFPSGWLFSSGLSSMTFTPWTSLTESAEPCSGFAIVASESVCKDETNGTTLESVLQLSVYLLESSGSPWGYGYSSEGP